MKKTSGWIKRISCMVLIGFIMCIQTSPAWATAASKAEKEKKEAQQQLDEANKKADQAETNKNAAQSQVKQLNLELTTLILDIQFMEVDIANKEVEIAQAEKDYVAAKKKEEKQYAAMKKRIQYMYEKGETEYLDVLLQVESMADLLNKAEYVEDIYIYDRNMLNEYEEVKHQVAEFKTQLEGDKSEMEVMQQELTAQKAQLETTIATKRKEVTNFDSQLAQAKADASAYAKTVAKKNEEIQKAKAEEARKKAEEARKKAEEDARKKAEALSRQRSGSTSKTTTASNKNSGPGATKSSGGTAAGRSVADYGLKFVGNPYVYGGTSLTNGADCSGFTQGVYRNFGVSIPRTSSEQRSVGVEVAYEDAQPGDLICYSGHVGIYIGNGQIVHASSPSTGIKTGPATYRTILAVRRVL